MSDPKAKAIPTSEELERVANLEIEDAKGEKVKFGSLFENEKVVVVFIRHFFCGACQSYVARLAQVSQASLEAGHIKIIVIGCGEWKAIGHYVEATDFHGPIFADPNRQLFHALGMDYLTVQVTPAGQQRKSYLTSTLLSTIFGGFWRGPMHAPSLIGKQGNIFQNGGEFILGPGTTCSFAHRMQHTEDHTEIPDLLSAAGVAP